MAITPRTRKRVRAIPRAPDGSAFRNWCGVSVAISLADMHECESSQKVKRFRGIQKSPNVQKGRFWDQPRSPFCFFMEEFKKTCESGDSIEIDRKGFETWKNMSKEERQPYVRKAARVDSAYYKGLVEEVNSEIDNEADSTAVQKIYPWEDCSDSGWHTYVVL
ncbi:hypothetical protein L484_012307 [Morus notabilis]|uniref:HMG box domain-containing protein n=1 Tax=Morus notabilis TaxID=981085 RepID=W9QJC0_9ROSA|nr:hypothetical protein L484_012307 [Morus notabilis]